MMLPFIISSGNSRRISAQIAALITLSCVFLCSAIDKLSTTDDIVKDIALEITDHDGIFRLDLNEIQMKDMKEKLSAVFSSADVFRNGYPPRANDGISCINCSITLVGVYFT